MAAECTAAEIKDRFESEQQYIGQYVEFLRRSAMVRVQHVTNVSFFLHQGGLPMLPVDDGLGPRDVLSSEQVKSLIEAIEKATHSVEDAITSHEKKLAEMPEIVPDGAAAERPDLLNEWAQWMVQQLVYDDKPEAVENLRQYAVREATRETDRDESLEDDDLEHIINTALKTAIRDRTGSQIDGLHHVLDEFDELRLVARIGEPEAEVNVLRQGFILLVTAFDAAVFDLVRVKLRKDFFALISKFGRDDKVTLEDFGDAGSFDALRDQIIEDQLKKRYVKDLLGMLQDLGVTCVEEAVGEKLVQLFELVLRRNVHVHNRGVVDERYLERNDKGKPKYNLYNLSLGDVAEIDEPYWQLANKLCGGCVSRIAAWATA